METIYLIRGSIGKFIKSFDLVIQAVLKAAAYYLLFNYVSNMEGIAGEGMINSMPVHLVLAVVSMLLPNRCGILLAILLGLYNISQVTMLGAIIAGIFFLVLYIMTSRLFPDHVYMLALIPLCLHFKMYLLLPLIAGMYLGIVALVPMICGAVMSIMLTLIPEFMNLQMPTNLDELPQILSDIFKYGFNQILHNEELVFVAIVFGGVVILVHLLRKMEINYGAYIALVAGTVLGLVCLFMGKMTFGISDSYIGIILRALLALAITTVIEFMHSALNYQSMQKLSFEDEEYQYYVTVIPKISVSKPKREVKTITEADPKVVEETLVSETRKDQEKPRHTEQRPMETPTAAYQPIENHQSQRREIPGMPSGGVQIEKSIEPTSEAADKTERSQRPTAPQKTMPEESVERMKKEPAVLKTTVKNPQKKDAKKAEEPLSSFFEED